MATNKKLDDELREKYLKKISALLEKDEEVLQINSNEIAIPCLDSAQNEKFIQVVIKIPTGSRDGEPFDGYAMAEDYQLKLKLKEEKKKKQEEEKQKKIERDKKIREKKKEMKEKREKE